MLRGDAAAVHSMVELLGVSVSIPPNIAANWYEFVAGWCLGVEPEETPSEVERAFDALRRLWPEFLNELEVRGAQGNRGIDMVVSAVARAGHSQIASGWTASTPSWLACAVVKKRLWQSYSSRRPL
jgi:hypothetical protein